MTKYKHEDKAIEEYIDLREVLDSLLMDEESFLSEINEVKVKYD